MSRIKQPLSRILQQSKALIYARVSSKEQEKEGFSIPAQLKLLQGYACSHGLGVIKEYIDVETAKESGRKHFEEMVRYISAHPTVRMVLVEKTDRLYRNFKDYVRLDELDIEIHLVKEGEVLSRDSRSSQKFIHGIKVLMAKNYIDNLSEETRKGMVEKAEQGTWPSSAPVGYQNVAGSDGKRTIMADPVAGPIISNLFGWYAQGNLSLADLAVKAAEAGLVQRKSGAPIGVSTLHAMLSKRIYMGDFDWKGKTYRGRHEPLVARDLWERVQDVLATRDGRKLRSKRGFAFSGLIACGHCGCALVAEIKKQRYVYYHCTGYKGKCPGRYVREEVLTEQFSKALSGLSLGRDTLQYLKRALQESHVDQRQEHDNAIKRLQSEYERLESRLQTLYIDKVDGTIDRAFYEKLSTDWRFQQSKCLEQIARHQSADQAYMDGGARLLDLAHSAHRLFMRQSAAEQQRLLKLLLSNSTWKDGELTATWRQPFDLIAETAMQAEQEATRNGADCARYTIWRPREDSNL